MANKISKIYGKQLDKTIKVLVQTGKSKSLPRDEGRPAKLPGKRVSKTGKIYWETRQNRSDRPLRST